jgi:hypothetical protein
MNDEWKSSAAHHEADHVIVARSRGITPNYVEIQFNPKHRRWEGTTELPELQSKSRIGLLPSRWSRLSGCFAQVKHAIRSLGSTEPIPWAELLDWTVLRSEQPLEVALADGKQIQVPSWWFEGGDKQTFNYLAEKTIDALGGHNFKALLQRGVKHTTIPVLDDVHSWRKVEMLAALLVASAVDGVGRVNPADYPL